MSTEKNKILNAALGYSAELGWPVFPCYSVRDDGQCACGIPDCGSPGKHPMTTNGFKDATLKKEQIFQWWARFPNANIGVATGSSSGIDVLDVDPRHGGEQSLADLAAVVGSLPNTVEQYTGSGGRHILFQHVDGMTNKTAIRPGLDIRGDGGYIVVAPSHHLSGGEYVWKDSCRPGRVQVADWPEGLLELARPMNGNPRKKAPCIEEEIPEGKRNATLTSIAGSMRHRGCTADEIEIALQAVNRNRCSPSLSDAEVTCIADSVGRYPPSGTDVTMVERESDSIDWEVPRQLPALMPAVEPFNPTLLPSAFEDWVEDIAERMQCPPDFPAVATMVATASVVGRQVTIRPKREDTWTVVPNLYGAVVGLPGVLLKTPALKEPLDLLERLEIEAKERYGGDRSAYEAGCLIAEERKKLRREDVRQALKDNQDATAIAIEAINEPAGPVRRRYIVNDTTVEKLGEILAENPNGVLLFRDELTGLLRSLDKDGQEGAKAFYLEAWNGTGRMTYDRVTRGTIDVEAMCVSILGGIQPGPLYQYLRRVARGGGDDDGLLQRFQLVVWPDLSGAWENHDRAPDTHAREIANSAFERLAVIDARALGAEQELGALPYLRFAPEAQGFFDEWRDELERRLREPDHDPLILSHLGKFRSLIPSLALLIHLADDGHGPVSEAALRRACAWGEYLESHALRVYAPVLSSGVAGAHALAKKLRKGDLQSGFTLRQLYRKHWRGLTTKEESQEAADVLEDLGWLCPVPERTAGRWATRYMMNPRIGEQHCGKVA